MKTNFYHLLVWLVAFSIGVPAMAQTGTERVKPFSHLSVSLNAGTLGGGLQVAAPLNDYLGLRAGFSLLKFNYNYDMTEPMKVRCRQMPVSVMRIRIDIIRFL